MKKKGFTLIELLAVIVILAVIALILVPVVSNIIASSRDAANQRSVEGHVSNVEYAIVDEAFNNGKETEYYDCVDSTTTVDSLNMPDSDKITCESYTIVAGSVLKALNCSKSGWDKKYDYIKGVGTTIATPGNDHVFDYFNIEANSSSNSTLSLQPGSYMIYLSYSNAYHDDSITNLSNSGDVALTYGNATCSVLNNDSNTKTTTNSDTKTSLNTTVKIYKCSVPSNTDISYNVPTIDSTKVADNVTLAYVKLEEASTDLLQHAICGNYGGGNCSCSGVEDPTNNGTYLSAMKKIYFNVDTGTKCTNEEWSTNGGNTGYGMKSGCLRFYVYYADGEKYTAILDRNTDDSRVAWNSTNNNAGGPVTALAKLKADTGSWQGLITPGNYTNTNMINDVNERSYSINYADEGYKARLITADEVAKIVNNETFSSLSSVSSNWFYLDGFTSVSTGQTWQTQIATASEHSAYYWLFDYTARCTNYGCYTINSQGDTGPWGYWTADATSNTTQYAWFVSYIGGLDYDIHGVRNMGTPVNSNWSLGIRPVISIYKSLVD